MYGVGLVAEGWGRCRKSRPVFFDPVTVYTSLGTFDYVATCFSHPLMQGRRKMYRVLLYRVLLYRDARDIGLKVYADGFVRDVGMDRIEERCQALWDGYLSRFVDPSPSLPGKVIKEALA